MQLVNLKLVTIVAEEVLKERLVHMVLHLGATGCTYHTAQGSGSRSARHDDVFGENFQMKVICNDQVAHAILKQLSDTYFAQHAIAAWINDVEVLNGDMYVKKH